jgi:hypothetical protein
MGNFFFKSSTNLNIHQIQKYFRFCLGAIILRIRPPPLKFQTITPPYWSVQLLKWINFKCNEVFYSFGWWCDTPIYNEKTPDRDLKTVKIAYLVIEKGLSFRPDRTQNGSTDEKHGFSQCYRLKRLRDVDSYASNPAKKYLIQEKNRIGRFEFPRKCRHMDIQGLSQSTPERWIVVKSVWIRWGSSIEKWSRGQKNEYAIYILFTL